MGKSWRDQRNWGQKQAHQPRKSKTYDEDRDEDVMNLEEDYIRQDTKRRK